MLSNATNTLAPYAPWLLSIFAKSTVVLLVALAAAKLMRRGSASLRHFLYAITIVGVLLLPLAAALLPALGLAILPPQVKTAEPAIVPVVDRHQPSEPALTKPRIRPTEPATRAEARLNWT